MINLHIMEEIIVNINIDDLKNIDSWVSNGGYLDRTDFIKEAIKEHLNKQSTIKKPATNHLDNHDCAVNEIIIKIG